MKTPLFDGEDSLHDVINWVSEPADVKERVDRVKEAAAKCPGFFTFLKQRFGKGYSFKELLVQGKLEVRTRPLGRWGYVPFKNLMAELPRYCDNSKMLPRYRRNQLICALDDTYGPDAKHIVGAIEGTNTLPDKLNRHVFALAFPNEELGEDLG